MPLKKTLESARSELQLGRKWRAKEILRSSLGNYRYELELYQLYGEVLLSMEDFQQAGKYLFFSKDHLNKEENLAVALFVNRHGKNGYKGVLRSFQIIHYDRLSQFPDFVQERLKELGAKESLYNLIDRAQSNESNIIPYGCLLLLAVMAGFCIIGFITALRWLF